VLSVLSVLHADMYVDQYSTLCRCSNAVLRQDGVVAYCSKQDAATEGQEVTGYLHTSAPDDFCDGASPLLLSDVSSVFTFVDSVL
jgi:hypothetical protein